MEIPETTDLIYHEIELAEDKFPGWPQDIMHGVGILVEEVGELVKACLDFYYGRGPRKQVKKEALQSGAMIYRFMVHLEEYETDPTSPPKK